MIAAYQPVDEQEALHRQALLQLLRTASEPFSRTHFVPGHVTASCFVLDPHGRLLLHHHRRLDRWLQMGGHLEVGEEPLDAALREAAEESGLRDLRIVSEGIADLDVHIIPEGRGEPEHRHFDVRYIAQTASPHSIVIDAQESRELMWFSLDRTAGMMSGEESLRVIQKIRRLR
jgi:8-oxo-dGTP pyrophosphatase MutT (NUDIX family)